MDNRLEDQYFSWLYKQVCDVKSVESNGSYTAVCRHMHDIPFKALVPNDSNRVADGAALRTEFLKHVHIDPMTHADMIYPDTTIFEVLVSLTERAEFMAERGRKLWFQDFLRNLDLEKYSDWYVFGRSEGPILRRLRKFNDRQYDFRGRGGLFPLKIPNNDQREVEIWYQMGQYINENHLY